ncbi:MAG: 5-carboxymethyl-2-hydroxymuconate Delta-isomerase [Rhizobiaceae bacterium]
MPHLTIEYSRNLDDKMSMDGFCKSMLEAALATGLFEIGAVRVRAHACDNYAISDGHPDNAFLDMSLRIGMGRDLSAKKQAGDAIFEAACDHLSKLFETPHFALSFEIREIDKELSWRKNAIHPRLRGQ